MYTPQQIKEAKEGIEKVDRDPLFQGDGNYICSDGRLVNFRGTTRNIQARMLGLDEGEIGEVLAMNSDYKVKMGKRNQWRRIIGGEALFKKNEQWHKCLERKEELLGLFGKMYSAVEVHKIITTEWNYPTVKYDVVATFQRENVEEIAKRKDLYQKDTKNLRLVHKRSRLDELTELYHSRKEQYERQYSKSDYELLLKTLEQIRKEVEGQQIHINGQIKIEHELAIQDHINGEILKHLNINDIIIGRLCSKLGVNPKYILYRLHTSYYSKFTGFVPDQMNTELEPLYPSQVVYDFTRIAQLNESKQIEDVEYKEEPEVSNPVSANLVKELLLKKLQEKKQKFEQGKKNNDSIDIKQTKKSNNK